MFCKNCGNELNENAKFCEKCGAEVKNDNNPPAESSEQATPTIDQTTEEAAVPPKKQSLISKIVAMVVFVVILIIVGTVIDSCEDNISSKKKKNNSTGVNLEEFGNELLNQDKIDVYVDESPYIEFVASEFLDNLRYRNTDRSYREIIEKYCDRAEIYAASYDYTAEKGTLEAYYEKDGVVYTDTFTWNCMDFYGELSMMWYNDELDPNRVDK